VARFTQIVSQRYPQEAKGCKRYRLHALLSTRRCLVDCPKVYQKRRISLDRQIRARVWPLLWDHEAPLRDKIGGLAVCAGQKCYDLMWKYYSRHR